MQPCFSRSDDNGDEYDGDGDDDDSDPLSQALNYCCGDGITVIRVLLDCGTFSPSLYVAFLSKSMSPF